MLGTKSIDPIADAMKAIPSLFGDPKASALAGLRGVEARILADPTNASNYNMKGLNLDTLGRYDEAITCYNQAIALDPTSAAFYSNQTKAFDKSGRTLEALFAVEQAIKYKPEYAKYHEYRGKLLCKLGQLEDGIDSFKKALEIKPRKIEYFFDIALALKDLNNFTEALHYCSESFKVNIYTNEEPILTCRAQIYHAMGKTAEAMADYDEAIRVSDGTAEAYFGKALLLKDQKKWDEALIYFDKAVSVKKDYAEAYLKQGLLLNDMGRQEEALVSFRRVLAIDGFCVLALIQSGVILNKRGELKEALACFDEASAKLSGAAGGPENAHSIFGQKIKLQTVALSKAARLVRLQQSAGGAAEYRERADAIMREALSCFEEADKTKKAADTKLGHRMLALEVDYTKKAEVSHAIKMNPLQEAAAADKEKIRAQPKLNNYYRAFCSAFNQSFVASMAQASGRVALQPKALSIPVEDLGKLIPVPFISEVAQALCTVTNMALKIYEGNNVRRLASLAMGITDMEDKIETAARKITLFKQTEIMAATEQSHGIVAWASKVKSKVYFSAYDTAEKKLALGDATRLLMSCMAGRVDAELDLVSQFVMLAKEPLAETKLERAVDKVDTFNAIGEAGIKAGSVAAGSGCCTIMKTTVVYDNPVLNDEALLKVLIEKKNASLFSKVLALGATEMAIEDIKDLLLSPSEL